MCGIFAQAGTNLQKTTTTSCEKALQQLSRRGPDDSGLQEFEGCILGQTRLAIIDLSPGGHQPMRDEALGLTIVFNGEIYNYKELREKLKAKGYTFRTSSDTEVILKAYAAHGTDCPKYLDGMFAFALWDEKKKTLFMARDRFGKKPLFYHLSENGTLTLASEIKALLASGITSKLDPRALDSYLALMYVPPWKTIYENIHTLPPAHRATYAQGKLETTRYWTLPDTPIDVSYEEAKKNVKDLLLRAVEKRMLAADVEVGALLSGGVDSTLVSAYAAKHLGKPLKTFTVGYEDHINELPYAEEASRVIGTEHRTLQAHGELVHELTEVMTYFDEPHADSSLFPQHLISKLTASHVKVALSGDGADELFLGYGWYSKWWNLPKLERLKNELFSSHFAEHLKYVSVFSETERQILWKDASAVNRDLVGDAAKNRHKNDLRKTNLFDLTTYLPGQLLTKIDRTSMMHSLEMRSPFLDTALAEYVFNLPTEYKMNRREEKLILKELLCEIMPREFVYRKKQGFGAPVVAWLREPLFRAVVNEKLRGEAALYTFLKHGEVAKLIDRFYLQGDNSVHYKIWSLLSLELWLESRTDQTI